MSYQCEECGSMLKRVYKDEFSCENCGIEVVIEKDKGGSYDEIVNIVNNQFRVVSKNNQNDLAKFSKIIKNTNQNKYDNQSKIAIISSKIKGWTSSECMCTCLPDYLINEVAKIYVELQNTKGIVKRGRPLDSLLIYLIYYVCEKYNEPRLSQTLEKISGASFSMGESIVGTLCKDYYVGKINHINLIKSHIWIIENDDREKYLDFIIDLFNNTSQPKLNIVVNTFRDTTRAIGSIIILCKLKNFEYKKTQVNEKIISHNTYQRFIDMVLKNVDAESIKIVFEKHSIDLKACGIFK